MVSISDHNINLLKNTITDLKKEKEEFIEDIEYIFFHGNRLTWMKLKKKWEERKNG